MQTGGSFSVALPGGNTPIELFKLLCDAPLKWDNTHFFWGDERCVPKEHGMSNYGLAQGHFLCRIDIPCSNLHRIKGELTPDDARADYEREINGFFGDSPAVFDLIVLGIGEDGHTASLFPGSQCLSHPGLVCAEFGKEPKRITLTIEAINSANDVLFMAVGRAKADAVYRSIVKCETPAGMIGPTKGRVIWLLDYEAASGLSRSD